MFCPLQCLRNPSQGLAHGRLNRWPTLIAERKEREIFKRTEILQYLSIKDIKGSNLIESLSEISSIVWFSV